MTPKEYRDNILKEYHEGKIDYSTFVKNYSRPPLRKTISKSKRMEVYKKYNGHCAYCGCELEYKEMQVDHFIPFDDIGDNQDLSNLMPACRQCNFYKSSGDIERLRRELNCILERLNKREFIYKLGKKYGLIEEKPKEIKFYFEYFKEENKQ